MTRSGDRRGDDRRGGDRRDPPRPTNEIRREEPREPREPRRNPKDPQEMPKWNPSNGPVRLSHNELIRKSLT